MPLIELLPSGLDPASNIAFSGANTFNGTSTFNGLADLKGMRWEVQSIVLAGGATNTTSIASNTANGSIVLITGTAATTQTINLPSSPISGDVCLIYYQPFGNNATFAGNGVNVDGASSLSASGPGTACLIFDGTQWTSFLFDTFSSSNRNYYGTLTFTSTATLSVTGTLNFLGRILRGGQSFATNGGTIGTIANTTSSGSYVGISGTTGGTINLPSAPTSGQECVVQDEGGNAAVSNITVSGNGKNINGASTLVLNANYKRITLRDNGTAWFGG